MKLLFSIVEGSGSREVEVASMYVGDITDNITLPC